MFVSRLISLQKSAPQVRRHSAITGVNKVILVGTVEGAPKVMQFENGALASFTMSTADKYLDKATGNPF
jgi:hypothetical protein